MRTLLWCYRGFKLNMIFIGLNSWDSYSGFYCFAMFFMYCLILSRSDVAIYHGKNCSCSIIGNKIKKILHDGMSGHQLPF